MIRAPGPLGIVLPVYNGAPFVDEALASVFAQTRDDWRLLVVDDASTDGSAAILARVRDPRVTVVRNARNLGLYQSLDSSVGRIQSEWIAILMQDDRLHPTYVEEMTRLVAHQSAADGIWISRHTIDERGARLATGSDTGEVDAAAAGIGRWHTAIRHGCTWIISGSVTRRRVFHEVPLRIDLPHCGDYDWFLRAVRSHAFVYWDRALIDLRQHPRQASAIHMRHGQHLAETFVVIDDQLRAHPLDLPLRRTAAIALHRTGQCVRSLVGNALRGHLRSARPLLQTAGRFLALPARAAARRWFSPARAAVPAPERIRHAGRR
jgi:glycosyltransferase involved in cell wall biosynthesis